MKLQIFTKEIPKVNSIHTRLAVISLDSIIDNLESSSNGSRDGEVGVGGGRGCGVYFFELVAQVALYNTTLRIR